MRLKRIQIRLILLLATLNIVIPALVYGIGLWNFDRSFAQYLEQKNLQQIKPVATALGAAYARRASWPALLADPAELGRALQGFPGPDLTRAHPPSPLLILDAAGRILSGPSYHPEHFAKIPIETGGRTVGYLGLMPAPHFAIAATEQAFVEQQRRSFALIALTLLLSSCLAAIGIARWLGKPVGELARGTLALARGESGVRIAADRDDEFGLLARQFNALAETLDAAHRARKERIADISHELRAPLTVLRGKIEAIEDGIHSASPERLRSLREDLARLAASVEDLHLLALAEPAALACRIAPLALPPLLDKLIASHRLAIERAGLACELELPDEAWIAGDPSRLAQLFGNLLHNSLRYTDGPGRIRIRLEREGGDWRLSWEDSAPGVGSEELDHLTERRFRGANAQRHQDGSGLGLAIVREIADAHGARLSAGHSALGGLLWEIHFSACEERPC